ncbi:piggyBac transposable element-derived protein 3-like [Macrosteles quadrilineatus]|uniref:piggyBac transposable element-derived protein 3-like n=1 Tax=Macrosteles quadrilineatus TaxID=74068 RepID=UPI0023E1F039|nr:piggyBac transposable element-derived protein 3-like [Macrosteles quadrilineatus]
MPGATEHDYCQRNTSGAGVNLNRENGSNTNEDLIHQIQTSKGGARGSKGKTKKKDLPKWIEVDADSSEKPPVIWDDVEPELGEIQTPIDYFRYFFDTDILDSMVNQSNLYSVQKDPNKPLNMSKNELEQFLGICVGMSIYRLPRSRMFWAKNTNVEKVSSVMSRNRWEEIKRNIHCNDNANILPVGHPDRDKLFKVRPLIDHFQAKFQALPKPQMLCVDEQIVPFKGKSGLKQYNPKKPYKWGYKLFILCDTTGLVHNFEVYTGHIEPVTGAPDLGASSNVVLRMTQVVPKHKGYLVYFDNWFASLRLFTTLAQDGIGALGTIQKERFPGLTFPSDSEMKQNGRGSLVEVEVNFEGVDVRALKWLDNRGVTIASTFESAMPVSQITRFDRSSKRNVDVPCPRMIKTYNKFMGGVDLLNGLIAYYRIKIRSKKYYLRLIFHFVDMAIVNGWLRYRNDCHRRNLPKKYIVDLLEFKSEIFSALCREGKDSERKRGRPSYDRVDADYEQKKHRGPAKPIPCFNERRDGIGHWPIATGDRQRCKKPGCKGQSTIKCGKCQVHLCLTKERNCFTSTFHI